VSAIPGEPLSPPARRWVAATLMAAGAAAVAAAVGAGALGLTDSSEFGTRQIALLGVGLASLVAGLSLLDGARRLALRHERTAVVAFALGLSVMTVWFQYQGLRDYQDRPPAAFVEHEQLDRHNLTIDGRLGDPWKYRLLAEWAAGGAIHALDDIGVDRPVLYGFLGLRLVENLAIFLLAWVLYRRLGLAHGRCALGLGLVAVGMTQALLDAGLAFDIYADVAFYLAAAVLLLAGAFAWIVPLTALAALNRETSGLIPVMTMAMAIPAGIRSPRGRRALIAGAIALAVFALTYAEVRHAAGPGELILPYGKHPGTELLTFNVNRTITWEYVARLVNVTPVLALLAVRSWPAELRWMAIAVVPAWIAIHLLASVLAEARLLLVPYALVLVPGALFIGLPRISSTQP